MLFALCSMISVACEETEVTPAPSPDDTGNEQPNNPNNPNDDPNHPQDLVTELILESEATINFDAEGGQGVIRYEIVNPKDSGALVVESDAEWISDINTDDAHTITFEVAANDIAETRSATIDVRYDTLSFAVAVQQAAKVVEESEYDVEFVAKKLNGTYYAQGSSSAYNYFFVLSVEGLAHEHDSSVTQYRFDVYSNTKTSSSAPVLPEGKYEIDLTESYAAGTCDAQLSSCIEAENGQIKSMFAYESGTITITSGHIEAELVDHSGRTHHVVYDGSLSLGY